jgi:hypothetical protein
VAASAAGRGDGVMVAGFFPPHGPHSPEQGVLEVVPELSQGSSLSRIMRIYSEIVLALALGQMLRKCSEEGRGVITRRISFEGGVECGSIIYPTAKLALTLHVRHVGRG